MVDEPHAVVKLLVARMESHPEEFKRESPDYHHRWYSTVSDITEYGNEADKAAIDAKLRDIRLGEAHEDMMDELLNGPDRRRKQAEDAEYERNLIMQQARAQRNTSIQQQAAQSYAQQYQNAAGTFTPGLRGKSITGTWIDEAYGTLTTMGTTTNANALQLGSEKLDEGILKKLKGLLK
jgi:hypothetical protein